MRTNHRVGLILLAGCALLAGCVPGLYGLVGHPKAPTSTPAQRAATAKQRLQQSKQPIYRFYALADAAKSAVNVGEPDKAQRYAAELLRVAPKYRGDWNYGNAIHDGHIVLGRVALARGDKRVAIKHLLAAGKTPGSPQLDSFGPNMSLAQLVGER